MLAADTLASYGSLAMFKDVTRIARTGSYTLVGASGELSDYHALLDKLKGLAQANANCDDGFEHGPAEIYSYLRAVLYQRRNKFDPLWNSLVVGGFKDGAPFLGSVDLRGTAYEDDVIATGYGSHLALPIMRAKWTPDLDEGEARALLEDCLRVLFYRDCRALNRVQVRAPGPPLRARQRAPARQREGRLPAREREGSCSAPSRARRPKSL